MIHRSTSFLLSFVPSAPSWTTIDENKLPKVPELTTDVIELLERLSLVEFNNKAGVDRLTKVIQSVNRLYTVDTDGVEPLDTVLEDRVLHLRDDDVTDGNCRKDIISNATKTVEDYFVAPPGNIPLMKIERDYKPDTKSDSTESDSAT
ncbi:glutamyl-tRNA(Gln) amidotransferase subunit C, mitochondrial-like isoform X2 [Mizuhopecten yessoensis]|uniref:Glutamyl-tRNA(Gln) amidotransferase subunit C, mitochondrial n=1 Tax=Mizuhopecten yessoensis TaxID=6573 RepID=A0A210PVB3_MIZYE|nr:glutamyl-tRNA(Gln) amidotransferase subunit C, mitochondrial-like isoform X2 [Mizuhopecten yessoensis]OWF40431.1 Glutamyl-tRNA(Gln) amidotransferase subunit C, mitochondrial [Mizuhopecten yessoensis]